MYERDGDGFIHGGTDSGPEPRYDFSSNANALGPNPYVLEKVKEADLCHYPDPRYTRLYEALAVHYNTDTAGIALGAGTSELIQRLVTWNAAQGAMLVMQPTFSEYVRAARSREEMWIWETATPEEFLGRLPKARLAFLCVPNSPTGEVYSFLQEAANIAEDKGVRLVLDLAYAPLSEAPIRVPRNVWQLYSPNKTHGLTGIRAGYLLAPQDLTRFRAMAPSWVLSSYGEAFLKATLEPSAQQWTLKTRQTLWQWRDELAAGLQELGLEVRTGSANFLLVKVGEATNVTRSLRAAGIRVRDCTSFGLPEWLRLSAQQPEARVALLETLHLHLEAVKDATHHG